MDELVKAAVSFLEYMILGALALGFIVVPWWKKKSRVEFLSFFKKSHPAVPQAFAVTVLAALMYFIGVIINCATIWLFQPAHLEVIHRAQEFAGMTNSAKHNFSATTSFYIRPFPPRRTETPADYKSFTNDYALQVKWSEEPKSSYDKTLGGLEKKLKLLRGAVLLLPIWAVLGVCAVVPRKNWKWLLLKFILCPAAYIFSYLFLMNCLWTAEMEGHTEVFLHSPSANSTSAPVSLKLSVESDGLKLKDINQPTEK